VQFEFEFSEPFGALAQASFVTDSIQALAAKITEEN
jgi:hypothetical protein